MKKIDNQLKKLLNGGRNFKMNEINCKMDEKIRYKFK